MMFDRHREEAEVGGATEEKLRAATDDTKVRHVTSGEALDAEVSCDFQQLGGGGVSKT